MKKVLSALIAVTLMLQLLVMFGTVSAAGNASLVVSSASGVEGATVTLEVHLVNNPGFHSLECDIEYDETKLELVSITAGEKLAPGATSVDPENQFIFTLGDGETPAKFIYMGVAVTDTVPPQIILNTLIEGDVTVAKLTFKMLATGTADVTVDCVESLSLDAEYNMNQFETASATGTVTVTEKPAYVLGDADGNGTVNMFDAIAIRRYLVNKEQNPLNGGLEAADVDGKPSVTMFDAIAIRRYLVNKEQYPFVQN